MILIRVDIGDTAFGLLEAGCKKVNQDLERARTEVVLPIMVDLNEKGFATLHRIVGRLTPPDFMRTSRLS